MEIIWILQPLPSLYKYCNHSGNVIMYKHYSDIHTYIIGLILFIAGRSHDSVSVLVCTGTNWVTGSGMGRGWSVRG
jgi:hypothetical protein